MYTTEGCAPLKSNTATSSALVKYVRRNDEGMHKRKRPRRAEQMMTEMRVEEG